MYHFVWIPKDRHKVFSEPYRSELKAIIQKIGYDYDIDIAELEVPVDHIDMVVRSEPNISTVINTEQINPFVLVIYKMLDRQRAYSYSNV